MKSVYFTFWTGTDSGYTSNDYIGCDTSYDPFNMRHNPGYYHSADNDDIPGCGNAPPVISVISIFKSLSVF